MCSDQPFLSLDTHVRAALTSPQAILVGFFDSHNCDAFVITYDTKRVLKYTSGSLLSVCGIPKTRVGVMTLNDILTDHPWNHAIRNENEFQLQPGECHHEVCEIGYGEHRSLVSLRRQLVLVGTEVVGVVCIGWKLDEPKIQSEESIVTHALGISESTLLERWSKLTPAELEVIEGIAQGHLNKTIARNLSLSMRTVEARRSRMMKKLGISSVPELVRYHLLVKQAIESKKRNNQKP